MGREGWGAACCLDGGLRTGKTGVVQGTRPVHWWLFPSPRPIWMGGGRKNHERGMKGDTGTDRDLDWNRGGIGR